VTHGVVAGGLFELFLWLPPPQLRELPAQEYKGVPAAVSEFSSGAVTEFEQPARLSARSAPRGRSVRMTWSPSLMKWNELLPTSASARPPHGAGQRVRLWEDDREHGGRDMACQQELPGGTG
jgi:hypothetical protein